jgi:hypothetical protein
MSIPSKTALLFKELCLEINEKNTTPESCGTRKNLPGGRLFQHGTPLARQWRVTALAASYIR